MGASVFAGRMSFVAFVKGDHELIELSRENPSNDTYGRQGQSDVVSVACFGVRVSVMFHLTFVHYSLSSVWVAERPPFGK